MSDANDLREHLTAFGQSHLLQFWEELDETERGELASQLRSFDIPQLVSQFKRSMEDQTMTGPHPHTHLTPIDPSHSANVKDLSAKTLQSYWETGLAEISLDHVGVLLMAGGQGTRLGVSYPKGMVDVGLPSRKSLFQLQAERIRRLEMLALKAYPNRTGKIRWYIMTSEATQHETISFFQSQNYFGLSADQIFFFVQGRLPCFTLEGKLILQSKSTVAMAPDGNGGLFLALRLSGALEDMRLNGIHHLHTYGVDNILVRVGDPIFIGYCVKRGADCAAKTVAKEDPCEAVGVVCMVDGNTPQVVEYSELPKDLAQMRESPDGPLVFRAGNIANHYFSFDFLVEVCQNREQHLVHHVAKKKIPFVDSSGVVVTPPLPNGLKLEKFVFDVFQFSKKFYLWEVDRTDEFSPLKNSDVAGVECPSTCRMAIYQLHRRWLIEAGALITEEVVECEISPLTSYAGEELQNLVSGQTFHVNQLVL